VLETKGQRTRNSILEVAAALATEEGLDPLSIGRLADAMGMSKSGLFAHFGSKEELQLATVDHAAALFVAEVIDPARGAPKGLARIWSLCDHMIGYSERQVFPGGCFFAATSLEMGARPGPVRDRLAAVQSDFTALLASFAASAIEQDELPPHEHPDRLAFELHAILLGADTKFVLYDDPSVLSLGRSVIRHRLGLDTKHDAKA
jgi:AcrR family transcriptional regulator